MTRYIQAIQWGLMVPEATAYHERTLRSAPARARRPAAMYETDQVAPAPPPADPAGAGRALEATYLP